MRAMTGIAAASVLGFTAVAGADILVHDQFPHSDLGFWADGQAGQWYDQRVADDFTIVGGATLTELAWIGHSENFIVPGGDLVNVDQFFIEIFNDNGGGAPGVSVFSMLVDLGDTNATLLDANSQLPTNNYKHTAALPDLNLAAGTYYLSIGSRAVAALDDGWAWNAVETQNNDKGFFQLTYGGAWQEFTSGQNGGDMAFQLTAVPAPGALALLGVAGLIGGRRRRRNTA